MIRAGQTYRQTLNNLNGSANHLRTTLLQFGTMVAGGAIFGAASSSAFGFNQTLEQSRIGIASLVRTFQNVDMEQSFLTAADIQQRLQIAGLKTTATYQELLRALQEGIGPALRENFNPEQIVGFTTSMTQAAAALSLPMDQLGQELRAIMDGTIDRNARIAKALQINNEDIKKWKASGTLFAELQKRLQAFSVAGDQAANTFGGAFSNMIDAVQMALGKGTEKTFRATTEAIKKLTTAVVTIDEEAGTFTFNEKIITALADIDKRISNFLKRLTADTIAAALENFVQTVGAVIDVLGNFAGAVVTMVNVMGPFAPVVATAAGNLILFSTALKGLSFLLLEPFRLIKAFSAAFTLLSGSQIVAWFGSLRAATLAAATGTNALSVAFKGLIAVAAAQGAVNIGRLIKEIYGWRDAVNEAKAAEQRAAESKDRLAEKLKKISEQTGVTITSITELKEAVANGTIVYDKLTKSYSKGSGEAKKAADIATKAVAGSAEAQKQATGEALEAMKQKYQEYASEVARLQQEIAGYQKSLNEELRAMSRTGMTDQGAWEDRKKEAGEYEEAAKKAAKEAKAALEAGDETGAAEKYKQAKELANDAKEAYKDLNKEVKDGEKVLVSADAARQTSMEGVKRSGELAIGIMREQQEAAQGFMDKLTKQSGFADLTEGMDAVQKQWLDNWDTMRAESMKEVDKVEDRIVQMIDEISGKTVYINIKERVQKAMGGAVARFAGGGKLSGYGGGDRIPALLEAGEYIIRKEAVSRFGAGVFHALNSLRLPELPGFAVGGLAGMQAGGAATGGETVTIEFFDKSSGARGTLVAPTQQDYREYMRTMKDRARLSSR